jgi:hypothetical protein
LTVLLSDATTGSEITARVMEMSRNVRLATPFAAGASTRRETSVPGRPLIIAAAASSERPCSALPFTATIRSPVTIPAREAGEASKTWAISNPPRVISGPSRSGSIETPIPAK